MIPGKIYYLKAPVSIYTESGFTLANSEVPGQISFTTFMFLQELRHKNRTYPVILHRGHVFVVPTSVPFLKSICEVATTDSPFYGEGPGPRFFKANRPSNKK